MWREWMRSVWPRIMMISDVEGNKCRDRPRLGWMERVVRERNRSVELGRQNALDRRRWESSVRGE